MGEVIQIDFGQGSRDRYNAEDGQTGNVVPIYARSADTQRQLTEEQKFLQSQRGLSPQEMKRRWEESARQKRADEDMEPPEAS